MKKLLIALAIAAIIFLAFFVPDGAGTRAIPLIACLIPVTWNADQGSWVFVSATERCAKFGGVKAAHACTAEMT